MTSSEVSPDDAWMNDAPCKGHGDVFYPPSGPGRITEYGPALAICRECPLIAKCRAWAERYGDIVDGVALHGVIAGMAPPSKSRKLPLAPRTCVNCASRFRPYHGHQAACSPACSAAEHVRQKRQSRARRSA